MPTSQRLRFRRSAAQLHALAEVERTIRATDTKCRRKYLRDFSDVFRTYQRVLRDHELEQRAAQADIILVGDYHALAASQRFTAGLVDRLSENGRPILLGVEAIVARDQPILDEWQRGEIDTHELCSRIRFETDWGYSWQPFRELLETARSAGARVYGLDCTPRQDMRSIRSRDLHAAAKIAELRCASPGAQLVVLFGESHLAPTHLPMLVRDMRPNDELLTILQNVDALYWLSAGEPEDLVEAVQVRDDVVCVFSATPLEKYESYRLCIERWKQERPGKLDLAPSYYNLIASLFRFLSVDLYGESGRFLVDELPEVWSVSSDDQLDRLLARRLSTHASTVRKQVAKQGSCFVPGRNVIVAREFRMPWAAEEATRFVHYACRSNVYKYATPEDSFYAEVMECTLAFVGSKILCPSRKLFCADDLATQRDVAGLVSPRAYQRVVQWIRRSRSDSSCHPDPSFYLDPSRRECAVNLLAQLLGSDIYNAYINGGLSKRRLRSLFFKDLSKQGAARIEYIRISEVTAVPKSLMKLRMVS